ncbi:MAG: hypothetical protein ACHP93_04740 [Solirubrobacterales bacterium]
MASRPYRPTRELGDAIERGELDFALALAKEVARERDRPLDLDVALALLPLVAGQQATVYDAWALRWLQRWISESSEPTIEQAAELAGCLADLPGEPRGAVDAIRRTCRMR